RLADGKAEARTFETPRQRIVELPEGLEGFRNLLPAHTDASVAHGDADAAVGGAATVDGDLSIVRREFDGIGDQRCDRLHQALGIDFEVGKGRLDLKRDFASGPAAQLAERDTAFDKRRD